MKTYPFIEIFYSLKGEGLYTGTPMLFLRLAGCNLSCKFCDTPAEKAFDLSLEEIHRELYNLSPECKKIVITGGEPNIHNLIPLAEYFQNHSYSLHLETNGEPTEHLEKNLMCMDFIALSPKTMHVSSKALERCDEIKYLIGDEGWKERLFKIDDLLLITNNPKRWVMPVAEPYQEGTGRNKLITKNIRMAIDFCKANPSFSLCCQIHKYLSIP